MTIHDEPKQHPYVLFPKKTARVYKIKPDTEWLRHLSCEQRRKFREQKEQDLGLPDGSLISIYEY